MFEHKNWLKDLLKIILMIIGVSLVVSFVIPFPYSIPFTIGFIILFAWLIRRRSLNCVNWYRIIYSLSNVTSNIPFL